MKNLIKYDNLIYTGFAISIISLLFIYLGKSGQEGQIAKFSLSSVFIFLFMHLFSIGYEQFIFSNKDKLLNKKKLNFDFLIFIPILFLIILYNFPLKNYIAIELFSEIIILNKNLNIDEYNLLCIAIFCGIYSKIFASIFIVLEKTHISNLLYLFKALGLLLGSILFYFTQTNSIVLILFLSEFLPLVLFTVISRKKIRLQRKRVFNKDYVFSSINVFGFDFIMKADLILLSYFVESKLIAFYTIGSSVFEGFIQMITSFKYKIIKSLNSKDFVEVKHIYILNLVICLLFFPAYILFDYLSLNTKDNSLIILALILQLTLLISCYGVLLFNLLEIDGKPIQLCILSMCTLIVNLLVGIILIPQIGIFGASIGSLVSFTVLSSYYIFYTRKKNVWNYTIL